MEPAKSQSKYDPLPSAEVNKVRESLKSSSMELRALVKDPLPDALPKSEVVRSNLATKDMNLVPQVENQSGDVDIPGSGVCMSIVPYRPNDANLGKKVSVHCSNVRRPNLMERRSSACTYEVIMFVIICFNWGEILFNIYLLARGLKDDILFTMFFMENACCFHEEVLLSKRLPPPMALHCVVLY